MGLVTDHLLNLLQRQVDENGVVLWCDPEGVYASLAVALALPNTRVARFNGSYLSLRREVDDLLNDIHSDAPPRLVIYFPHELTAAARALDEFLAAGVLIQPGGRSLPLNTNLEVVARQALKPVVAPARLEEFLDQIRKGQITSLADLDRLAAENLSGVLSLTYSSGQPDSIALDFLSSPDRDPELLARASLPELAALLSQTLDLPLPADASPSDLRSLLGDHLLLADFRASLSGPPPEALATVRAPEPAARETCVRLAREWRNRRDLQDSYAAAARRAETRFAIATLSLDWRALQNIETFPVIEERLQSGVEESLLRDAAPDLLQWAEARRSGYWASQTPDAFTRWAIIITAGHLLQTADRILAALKISLPPTAADLIERYTSGPQAWCALDTHHRHLERFALTFDLDPHGEHASLEQLLARARQRYADAVDTLARAFITSLQLARFDPGGVLHQTEVFARHVTPALASGKTAYVLVDALRFEMAREMAAGLDPHWQVNLQPALATPPTLTVVGMAALLLGAERGLALTTGERGLAVELEGRTLKTRQDRVRYLSDVIAGFCEVKLEDLAPSKQSIREKIKASTFILVTSQEIDLLGEGDSQSQAREFMDSALARLARAFRLLAELGVERIVIAADHGYIFAGELDSAQTLPAPGGETAELHRRVWVGKGGQALEGALRVPVGDLNLGGDFELVTPLGLACFAAPGGRAYFHGGLSLQELVIPVLVIQPAPALLAAKIQWEFTPGRDRITTRFFTAQINGRAAGLFEFVPPRVRVEVRAGKKVISSPVAATYGFKEPTGEIELRPGPDAPQELDPNTITLMLTGEWEQKQVAVLLIDAESDRTLAKFDVDVAISL